MKKGLARFLNRQLKLLLFFENDDSLIDRLDRSTSSEYRQENFVLSSFECAEEEIKEASTRLTTAILIATVYVMKNIYEEKRLYDY